MGRYIIRLEDHYLEWSTVVDAPTTFGMTLDEFRAFYREEYGASGSQDLDERLARASVHGTSAYSGRSAVDVMSCNRAGPNESRLHIEEIVEFYVRRRRDPSAKAVVEFRSGLEKCGDACPAIERNGAAEFCLRCWGTGFVR